MNKFKSTKILKMHKILDATAFTGLTAVASANTGAQGYFVIYNNTAGNIVTGFFTNDGSGWSSN